MTLNQLRAFLIAARTGSFTAAAQQMKMSQASVSELVRRLEEEYRLPLFTRQPRRLVLTTAGETLLPYAEQSVNAADSAEETLLALRSLGGGVATFGVLRNADYYFLTDLVKEFHQAYPKIQVRLVGQNSVDVAASVAAGQLEAGLVVLPIDDAGLRVRPLLRDEVLFASADPAHLTEPMTTRRLAEARLILYDAHYGWRDPTRRQMADRAQMEGVKLEAMIEVEHVEAALGLVACGVGDTFLSRAVTESSAFPAGVGTVPFAEPVYDTIALVQRESMALSPATAEIARLAQRMLLARSRVVPGNR